MQRQLARFRSPLHSTVNIYIIENWVDKTHVLNLGRCGCKRRSFPPSLINWWTIQLVCSRLCSTSRLIEFLAMQYRLLLIRSLLTSLLGNKHSSNSIPTWAVECTSCSLICLFRSFPGWTQISCTYCFSAFFSCFFLWNVGLWYHLPCEQLQIASLSYVWINIVYIYVELFMMPGWTKREDTNSQ